MKMRVGLVSPTKRGVFVTEACYTSLYTMDEWGSDAKGLGITKINYETQSAAVLAHTSLGPTTALLLCSLYLKA